MLLMSERTETRSLCAVSGAWFMSEQRIFRTKVEALLSDRMHKAACGKVLSMIENLTL